MTQISNFQTITESGTVGIEAEGINNTGTIIGFVDTNSDSAGFIESGGTFTAINVSLSVSALGGGQYY